MLPIQKINREITTYVTNAGRNCYRCTTRQRCLSLRMFSGHRCVNKMVKTLNPEEKREITPHCDYHGVCKKKPFAEVYPENGSWSYLCFWHFIQERILGHFKMWCRAESEENEYV